MSRSGDRQPAAVHKVYVGGLGNRGDEHQLRKQFEEFGDVVSIFVARQPPGFAFVEFAHRNDAVEAVANLNGRPICGHVATVSLSHGKSRWPGGRPPSYLLQQRAPRWIRSPSPSDHRDPPPPSRPHSRRHFCSRRSPSPSRHHTRRPHHRSSTRPRPHSHTRGPRSPPVRARRRRSTCSSGSSCASSRPDTSGQEESAGKSGSADSSDSSSGDERPTDRRLDRFGRVPKRKPRRQRRERASPSRSPPASKRQCPKQQSDDRRQRLSGSPSESGELSETSAAATTSCESMAKAPAAAAAADKACR